MIIYSTFSDAFNAFLKSNAFYIALAIVGVILITLALIVIFGKKNKK